MVAGGIVYVGSEDHTVYAIDGEGGTLIWSYETGGQVRSTPAVAAGSVFSASQDGYLYALSERDGTFRWQTKVDLGGGDAPGFVPPRRLSQRAPSSSAAQTTTSTHWMPRLATSCGASGPSAM